VLDGIGRSVKFKHKYVENVDAVKRCGDIIANSATFSIATPQNSMFQSTSTELHGITTQKTVLFIVTAVIT
jgi:hypothetical protein